MARDQLGLSQLVSKMKKIVTFFAFAGVASAALAQVTLDIAFGVLSDVNGNVLPNGTLVQIIASTDTIFTDPTETSFVGESANDSIIFSGALNSATTGISGAAVVSLANINYANQYITLRWFPGLSSGAVAPGATTYGQYGYADNSSWVAPSAGGTSALGFLTVGAGGSLLDTSGRAVLSIAAIPEPSTYVLIAMGLGLVGLAIRRRAQRF